MSISTKVEELIDNLIDGVTEKDLSQQTLIPKIEDDILLKGLKIIADQIRARSRSQVPQSGYGITMKI